MSSQIQAPGATRWSLIVRAQGSGSERRAALGELLGLYEGFVLSLLRRWRRPPDTSLEDLKQDFFAILLKNDHVDSLDRQRGSFRAWLYVAVRRFVLNEWSKWHATKSGRKLTLPSEPELLDVAACELATGEDECWRDYARCLVLHALALLRDEARDKQRFDALARFTIGPQLDLVEYEPCARALNMTTNTLAKAVCVLRGRHKELIRVATRDLNALGDDCDAAIDEELAELRRHLLS